MKPIALHYLKGWFVIDAGSLLPSLVDILPFVKGSALEKGDGESQDPELKNLLRILGALRLLKLVRIVRIGRLVARWRTRVSLSFSTITAIQLLLAMGFGTHWLACLLMIQTIFAERRTDTWLGAFGWCAEIEGGMEECAHHSETYITCMHWAFGVISGRGLYPSYRRTEDATWNFGVTGNFTTSELIANGLLVVFGAFFWTYVMAQILDIVFNANPDHTAFKNRMDNLNRFISFNDLHGETATKLREYFWETRMKVAAEARQEICGEMSTSLQELACGQIHGEWLQKVPFFKGLLLPGGEVMAPPVSSHFIAQVASHLSGEVYVPMERPPLGRLYQIFQGSARYRGCVRQSGFSWGALDVMLPNAPLQKRAIATTYLHVLWIDGKKLRMCAKDYPDDARSMRTWTLWSGLKEYLLDNLRHASAQERRDAKEWVRVHDLKRSSKAIWRSSITKIVSLHRITAPSKTPVKARTIPQLQSAIERKLDKFAHGQPLSDHLTQGMNARFEALERKLDSVLTALPQSSLALRQKKKRALLVALPGRASTRSSAGQSVPLPTGSPGASSGQVQISVSVLASSGQVWPSASAEVERLTA